MDETRDDIAPEPEPDAVEQHENDGAEEEHPKSQKRENGSRYFFATMCFLIALLLLSLYLNNALAFGTGLLLLLGMAIFGYIGILFLLPGSILNRRINEWMDEEDEGEEAVREAGDIGKIEEDGQDDEAARSEFEVLVEEALALIPAEFHEQMENVLVRVEYEPGREVLRRVGVKRGYTLLGLYEGVPLTAYGRIGGPEIITIYQRNIEWYCGGDADRIREQVRRTVLHEVAHHFGIGHEEMPIWVK